MFALGLVAGAGACVLVFMLLEWFGFEISANSGFLAALLGAFVGGVFTIVAQMMAADAAAKAAKAERDEQSLKIEKAIAQSILLKIHDYQNATIPMGRHYSNRTEQNSLIIGGVCILALESPYSLRDLKFSIEEKSMCLDWENHDLINRLNDIEGLSNNLKILHSRYSEKIVAYLEAMNPRARGHIAEAVIEKDLDDDVKFQQLSRILDQVNDEFSKAKAHLPSVRELIESELATRFGQTIESR